MNHIPGLDRYLTTPPEDMFHNDYEDYAEKVVNKLNRDWDDRMETRLQEMYEYEYTIDQAVNDLEQWESEN